MEQQPHNPTQTLVCALVARMTGDTERFNRLVTNVPVPDVPTVLNRERLQWANTAFEEEMTEFNQAVNDEDVLEAADGLIDLVFFALGRLGEMGIPAKAVWEGVAAANLLKKQGSLAKRPGSMGHDAVKPDGWAPPNHSFLLGFSLADVGKARMFDELSPVFQDLTRLRAAKGADYNDVPGGRDAYFPYGHHSYAHMLNTKHLRLQSLLRAMDTGKPTNFEGILDTVKDLVNYGAFYAEAMMDGRLNATSSAQSEGELA